MLVSGLSGSDLFLRGAVRSGKQSPSRMRNKSQRHYHTLYSLHIVMMSSMTMSSSQLCTQNGWLKRKKLSVRMGRDLLSLLLQVPLKADMVYTSCQVQCPWHVVKPQRLSKLKQKFSMNL